MCDSVLITPGVARAADPAPGPGSGGLTPADRASLAAGIGIAPKAPLGSRPKGPNPFLAEVPDATKADSAGWANYMRTKAKDRARVAARNKARSMAAATSGSRKIDYLVVKGAVRPSSVGYTVAGTKSNHRALYGFIRF